MSFGFQVGLSTPSDKIADVYNRKTIGLDSGKVGDFFDNGMKSGYNIGVKIRLPLSDNFTFVGGFSYNKFPESEITVKYPTTTAKMDSVILTSTTNIVPINAGINIYLFKSFLAPYISADLTYNYISSSLDYKYTKISIPLSKSEANSRMGFSVGAGMDLNLKLITVNLEGKYHYLNLIGKEDAEAEKSYFTLCAGIYF